VTPEDALQIRMLLADYGHVVDDHDWDRAHEVSAGWRLRCRRAEIRQRKFFD
jgi:hypothetical protein